MFEDPIIELVQRVNKDLVVAKLMFQFLHTKNKNNDKQEEPHYQAQKRGEADTTT
jgi:hypothetical protein